ncbi:unnamed protein product [Closterium sp. Naga37s-1]|nr:unnamed protein product [Closterium sp. Naga37s-1]
MANPGRTRAVFRVALMAVETIQHRETDNGLSANLSLSPAPCAPPQAHARSVPSGADSRAREQCSERTRAVFRVALTAVETIQHRDIEIGRSVGNFLLRFLDRMKPSAHIRGDGPHMPGGSAATGGVHSSHAPPTPGGAAAGGHQNHAAIPGGAARDSGVVAGHSVGGTGPAAAGMPAQMTSVTGAVATAAQASVLGWGA